MQDGHDAHNHERPIFVPIPKIADIGLIDSPLVTGITAVDALTPIGKGQNMLVIGKEETLDEERAAVVHRGSRRDGGGIERGQFRGDGAALPVAGRVGGNFGQDEGDGVAVGHDDAGGGVGEGHRSSGEVSVGWSTR